MRCSHEQQKLILNLKNLVRSQSDFDSTSCAAAAVTILAEMPNSVSELGLSADLASGFELPTPCPAFLCDCGSQQVEITLHTPIITWKNKNCNSIYWKEYISAITASKSFSDCHVKN